MYDPRRSALSGYGGGGQQQPSALSLVAQQMNQRMDAPRPTTGPMPPPPATMVPGYAGNMPNVGPSPVNAMNPQQLQFQQAIDQRQQGLIDERQQALIAGTPQQFAWREQQGPQQWGPQGPMPQLPEQFMNSQHAAFSHVPGGADWRGQVQDWRQTRPEYAAGMPQAEMNTLRQDWWNARPMFPRRGTSQGQGFGG